MVPKDKLLQIVWSAILFTEGIGLTIIENVCATPEQAFDIGVTVIKVEIGILDPLVAVKELIFPVPETGTNPTALFELTHWYNVLGMVDPEKVTGRVDKLVHNDWSVIKFTVGVGFIVIEKLVATPLQELETGVTVITAVIGKLEALVPVKAAIFPAPEAGIPMPVLLLVHK